MKESFIREAHRVIAARDWIEGQKKQAVEATHIDNTNCYMVLDYTKKDKTVRKFGLQLTDKEMNRLNLFLFHLLEVRGLEETNKLMTMGVEDDSSTTNHIQ